MKSHTIFAMLFMGLMFALIIGCGQPKPPTPTSIPSTLTPTPTPEPTVQPTSIKESVGLLELQDLLGAYASAGRADQSRTPRELYRKIHGLLPQPHAFPRVVLVLLDEEGRAIGDFGVGGVAFPIERFVVTVPLPNLRPEDLPPPLQGKNIRPGAMLVVGERPDGAPDYEILKRSVARNEKITLGIFERQPNPRYPFTSLFPFEIQDLSELREKDSLIFYGYTQGHDGKYYPTEKPATISMITSTELSIKMNGSVTGGDFGAPVFSYQCGVEKLVGITISSFAREGRETEAFVIGMKEVLKFFEASTGVRVQVKESKNHCPPQNLALKDRAIQTLSDGRYDFSYDLCDLKDTCGLEKERQWVRPFQEVRVSRDDLPEEAIMAVGNAFLTGPYVGVIHSVVPLTSWLSSGDRGRYDYDIKYRLLWGENYEYLEFIGFDNSGKIAVFKRPDGSKFPVPPLPIASLVGNSAQLKVGNALLSIGAADLSFFTGRKPFDMRQTVDPASLIGFSEAEKKVFFIQGQMHPQNIGAGICALRDGECEFVGFLYAPLSSEKVETLNQALSIEFVLSAMQEVILGMSDKPEGTSEQTRGESSSLLPDLTRPDLGILSRSRVPISVLLFDETGSRVQSSSPVQGEALILSNAYLLTSSALFPKLFTLSDSGLLIEDTRDITSNTFISEGGKKLEARIVLSRTSQMDTLDVVLIDQKNGYALLKKTTPGPLGSGTVGSFPLVSQKDIKSNQEILLAYSQILLGDSSRTVNLVSPGTITYAAPDSSMFIVNAFVSPEILGAPIFAKCDGQICAVGILTRAYPVYVDQIKTEGFGVPLDFIFEKIKEKTGIDLRLEM